MSTTRRAVLAAALCAGAPLLLAAPAGATIHPIVQSIWCASAHVGDPTGQTPAALQLDPTIEQFNPATGVITFTEPVEFDNSDFRAMFATGVIASATTTPDGAVTSMQLAFTSKALSGQAFAHCKNSPLAP